MKNIKDYDERKNNLDFYRSCIAHIRMRFNHW